ELEYLNLEDPTDEQGFRTILVTNMSHPYAGAWWAAGHVIGYENTFIHAAADFLNAVAKHETITPNFHDGEKIIRTLEAAALSSDEGRRVEVSEIK
ncbi:MAG: gfo/Idh/MocA family oxidoreductase, partial [Christensenella sp.]